MMAILAAATEAIGQQPGALTTYGPWGILIALGGWKGIAQGILWLQGRNGNGNGKYVEEKMCKLRHEHAAAESANLVKSMDALNASVTRLHERFDDILRERADK